MSKIWKLDIAGEHLARDGGHLAYLEVGLGVTQKKELSFESGGKQTFELHVFAL